MASYQIDENGKPVLSEEDLENVAEYLNSPIHQVERKDFKPIYFVFLSVGSVTFLLGLAWIVTSLAGIDH